MEYIDPKTRVIYDIDEQGLLIERKNNVPEVWAVIKHLENHLHPPMQHGIYPKTRPAKRYGNRIELNCLGRWEADGLLNVLIYPADWELLVRVESILDQAITDDLGLYLTIDRDRSEVPGHLRIKYEHTKRKQPDARL